MTDIQAKKLRELIRRLVLAEVANSWSGSAAREDQPIIAEDLRRAKIRLSLFITELSSNKPRK
ncbi:MAG: hypothetical protein E6Q97_22175 [Desulfurellales bacterium]|nr:MAG: hypothetical protein E6Q97_22175 [Desulfurellales bacterium]